MLIILSQLIFLFSCCITDTRWHPSVQPPGRGANPFQTGKVEYEFDKTHPDYPCGSHADLADDYPEPPFIYKENLQCKGTKSFISLFIHQCCLGFPYTNCSPTTHASPHGCLCQFEILAAIYFPWPDLMFLYAKNYHGTQFTPMPRFPRILPRWVSMIQC